MAEQTPGQQAVYNVIEAINKEIVQLTEQNQLDAISYMQFELWRLLNNRLNHRGE